MNLGAIGKGVSSFVRGFGNEASAAAKDVSTVVTAARADATGTRAVLKSVGDDLLHSPRESARLVVKDIVDPLKADVAAGEGATAAGRATFHALSTLIPGDKVVRAGASLLRKGGT